MPAMTKQQTREIIENFAKEVREKRVKGAKPSREVINFRTDAQDGRERQVWYVPIDILRFRKDNGRISSDVLHYERNIGPLQENDQASQDKLREFLEQKDPEKTSTLIASIHHAGQQEPAIITCDGFLINGNRRKMVLEKLRTQNPHEPSFGFMKCVILPGNDNVDEGGPPTLLEIEKLENRYQLQSDGKSEYYGFDRALSIKRKIEIGLSLEEQLRDDPRFVNSTKPEIDKAIKDYEKEYLRPLECVDRYLKQFKRPGQYLTISSGVSDPEGRWQAFKDYSQVYSQCFMNPKKLLEFGIDESEIGSIEESAFDIIRLRTIPDMPKVHDIMRHLPKYCRTKEGKREILKIAEEVEPTLPKSDCFDNSGNPLTPAEIDAKWAAKYKQHITHHLKKAANRHEVLRDKETPLSLLESALKKLTHPEMDTSSIMLAELKKAHDLAVQIQERANELEGEIFEHQKNIKKLESKGRKK